MSELYVMAGCNGAGKSVYASSFIPKDVEYINPDKMVKDYIEKNPGANEGKAWKHTVKKINDNLKKGASFAFETTLAGNTALKKMADAKKSGYKVNFIYIALNSLEKHHERVANRVTNGGHDIPFEDINRHFRSSYGNLPKALVLSDKATVYDNSNALRPTVPVMRVENGKIVDLSNHIPDPLLESLKHTKLKVGERINLSEKKKSTDYQTVLPDNSQNIVGKTKVSRSIMDTDDWVAAKERLDLSAAERVVDATWTEKKTDQLKRLFDVPEKVVFLTQPSTSRTNAIPVVFAEKLSKTFNSEVIIGNEHFDSLHSQQSKHISRLKRPFHRREYESLDKDKFKDAVQGKSIVLVEDVLTTGGSVAEFTRHLSKEGVKIQSVVALMGDRRLKMDQKTTDRLEQALQDKGIDIPVTTISGSLTRAEAGGLIMLINGTRSQNGIQKLTENLRGLSDRGTSKSLEGNQIERGYESSQGKDRGNESIAERVQPWHSSVVGKTEIGEGGSGQKNPLPELSTFVSQRENVRMYDKLKDGIPSGKDFKPHQEFEKPDQTISLPKQIEADRER